MADQDENELITDETAVDDETGVDDDDEVEGFTSINTTRDNIPRRPRPSAAGTAGGTIGGVGGAQPGIAIKEMGVK